MASQPPQPPESITLGNFEGVRNTAARHRLKPEELEQALNVDIDDRGQVRRRRGYTQKIAGNFHSLKTIGQRVYCVKDGQLGWVSNNFQFTSFGYTAGTKPLSYTTVADVVYFASEAVSGKIVDGAVEPWGAIDADEWISPVITPTSTLGELFGKKLVAPPTASEIATYKGRIYLAGGRYLWATELWLYDYIDKTKNFLQFEEDITMLAPMDDGMFVGTEANLWYLKGTLTSGMQRENILEYGVVRGSMTAAPATDIHPGARQGIMAESMGALFLTSQGICAGFDGGEVYNITRGRVEFPSAQNSAVLYREDSGVSSYVAVTDSGGGPAANSRIGDYVDAEIVRRGG